MEHPATTAVPQPQRRRFGAIGALAVCAVLLLVPGSPASAQERTTSCPRAATANGRYVTFLFEKILFRCPDAGAARYWTSVLDRGASRWAVADGIDTSTENLGRNNVDLLYQLLLERAPTAAERAHGIDQLRRTHENATLTVALLSSDEAFELHTSAATASARDEEWLALAYNRILDRAPDPQGAAHYLKKLRPASTPASRAAVAMSLERSASNANSWVRAAMTAALGRAPDAAGVRYWTTWLTGPGRWQTFRLWTRLLSSDEVYRRLQSA